MKDHDYWMVHFREKSVKILREDDSKLRQLMDALEEGKIREEIAPKDGLGEKTLIVDWSKVLYVEEADNQ